MPTPNSTTIRIDEIELLACRSNSLVAYAISPLAIADTRPMVIRGSRARIGARKMISRVTRMITKVPMPIRAWPRLEESCWSSACAAEPPSLTSRFVPLASSLTSSRSTFAASACLGCPAFLLSIWTRVRSYLPSLDGRPGTTFCTWSMCFLPSSVVIRATSCLSSAVSLPPSLRWYSAIADGVKALGNALCWRSAALIDS